VRSQKSEVKGERGVKLELRQAKICTKIIYVIGVICG
jgi:hypothetical protein